MSNEQGDQPPTQASLKIDARDKSEVEGVQIRDGGAYIAAVNESKVKSIVVGRDMEQKMDASWSWRSPATIVGLLAIFATIAAALIGVFGK